MAITGKFDPGSDGGTEAAMESIANNIFSICLVCTALASLLILSSPVSHNYNCEDYDKSNLIRSEIMLQVVLKNYGYYTAKIDGDFGPASKKALKEFQSSNNLVSDGILGKNTCKKLNNKANVVKKSVNTAKSINTTSQITKSTEILNVQRKLSELGFYLGEIDGINVTVPFKNSIIPYIDELSLEAEKTQSVNTIYHKKES